MRKNNPGLLRKAHDYAFLLLKFRLRSEKELYQRLQEKNFDEGIINETILFLKDKGFLDDRLFAQRWTESRLRRAYGPKKIREELKLKGIDRQIIDAEMNRIKSGYPQREMVSGAAAAYLQRLKNLQPQAIKRRLYAYLMRRGFSSESAIEEINRICAQTR